MVLLSLLLGNRELQNFSRGKKVLAFSTINTLEYSKLLLLLLLLYIYNISYYILGLISIIIVLVKHIL